MSKQEDTELEDEIFDILNLAFTRQECAAKAAARLELSIVEKHLAEESGNREGDDGDPSIDDTVVSHASREFNADQFLAAFANLNTLRLTSDLITLLNLVDYEDTIFDVLIQDMFKARSSGKPVGRTAVEETFIGSDNDLILHNLRRAAERAQRSGRR
jgi:hypothetical protein